MVIFAQVVIICVSMYNVSAITESFKEYRSHMNFKHFGKRSSRIERGGIHMPLYLVSKKYIRDNNANLSILLDFLKAELSDN